MTSSRCTLLANEAIWKKTTNRILYIISIADHFNRKRRQFRVATVKLAAQSRQIASEPEIEFVSKQYSFLFQPKTFVSSASLCRMWKESFRHVSHKHIIPGNEMGIYTESDFWEHCFPFSLSLSPRLFHSLSILLSSSDNSATLECIDSTHAGAYRLKESCLWMDYAWCASTFLNKSIWFIRLDKICIRFCSAIVSMTGNWEANCQVIMNWNGCASFCSNNNNNKTHISRSSTELIQNEWNRRIAFFSSLK